MTSNGKQFAVTLEMLTAVACYHSVQLKVVYCCRWNLSAFFKICFCVFPSATHLFWKKSLNDWNDWSLGNSKFCFPRISMFYTTSCRETMRFSGIKLTVPFRSVNKSFMFLFEKRNHHLHMWTFYWQRNLWQNLIKLLAISRNCF